MKFTLTILGNSSATPTKDRFPTSQLLNIQDQFFLIDCGEGTQMRLKHLGVKFLKINHIFISHLHGDHFFGLIGLLSTMHLFGRKQKLNIYAPKELQEIIELQLRHSQTMLNYSLNFVPLQEGVPLKIAETNNVEIHAFPLTHRIPTWGFKFIEKAKEKNIKEGMVEFYHLTIEQIKQAKQGQDILLGNGHVLVNAYLTTSNFRPLSYAFCSDTAYDENTVPSILGVDVLYHEATFLSDLEHVAIEKFHSTAKQAALIAQKAHVKTLFIGHFSARYDDLTPLLVEAKEVFEHTLIADDGVTFDLRELTNL